MPRADRLSKLEARRLAIHAQGLGTPRSSGSGGRPGKAPLRRLLHRLGTIQLDAVNVVERTQFIVPFSRLGRYDKDDLLGLTGPGGAWFEYWGHAASLMPIETYPLFRWQMERRRRDLVDSPVVQARRRQWRQAHTGYLDAVLREVTERGPLAASQLAEPRRRSGEWWGRRSEGRQALEVLFDDGVLAAWRSPNFERVYDLTERVIPSAVLDLPVPTAEEAQRELIAIGARCLGVATAADLADYFWIRPGPAKLRIAELVDAGRLVPVAVENWDRPAFTVPGLRRSPTRRHHGTLLSPFDSLIWFRDRANRLFDFHYRIEIYVPEHLRTYGYYVMPLLLDDALVARFDLKADRPSATLDVRGSYLEEGVAMASVVDAAAIELREFCRWLGLAHVAVAGRGRFATAVRRAVAAGDGT